MQRFKMITEQAQVSSLMAVSTCATFDRQIFSAMEGVVENLLASDWLQVVCIIWVQDNQTSKKGKFEQCQFNVSSIVGVVSK